jgi:uncharacterized protein
MTTNRITLITLGVADLARARAFYEAIGWVLEQANDDVAFYALNGAKFGLYRRAKLAEDLNRPPETLGMGAMTLAQNFATTEEVGTAYARALAAGATALKPPEKVFWGGYSGTLADPDGHVWEYAMNPFWSLDADGHLTP